jgi:GTP-binding protein HflX
VLASDTVGFIRNLPTTVVKAFRATLEEAREAALMLHVVDISSASAEAHTTHVEKVLREIGAAEIPQILVMNKMDRLPAGEVEAGGEGGDEKLARRLLAGAGLTTDTRAVAISALTGAGIPRLLQVIDEALPFDPLVRVSFRVPVGDGATLALLHEFGRVLGKQYGEEWCEVEAEIPESLQRRLAGSGLIAS